MKRGTVKYFHPKKKFGYIDVPDEPAVVFHLLDGKDFLTDERGVRFAETRTQREPKVGDAVLFFAKISIRSLYQITIMSAQRKRFRANPWGFADEHDKLEQTKKPAP